MAIRLQSYAASAISWDNFAEIYIVSYYTPTVITGQEYIAMSKDLQNMTLTR